MRRRDELPIPEHFDEGRVGEIWRVDYGHRFAEAMAWSRGHELSPACEDRDRIGLLVVDVQNTFCLPDFELPVAGAVEDVSRLCRFVYRNLHRVSEIVVTLDTHGAEQIFHPLFLVDSQGRHPDPMTPISLEDVEAGTWSIAPRAALHLGLDSDQAGRHLLHYCGALSRGGKYQLMIWPFHAMLGGIGHALVPAAEETFFFHSVARSSPVRFEAKGRHPLTENYSVLRPEVLVGADDQELATPNTALLDGLLDFDTLVIAGQAKSHCVAWTVDDLLEEISKRDPKRASRVYLLEDCCSPVVVPGVADFTEQAEEAFERFAAAGMHRVRSTDAMEDWPGFESR
jgi:nicotinamidase-related amidase